MWAQQDLKLLKEAESAEFTANHQDADSEKSPDETPKCADAGGRQKVLDGSSDDDLKRVIAQAADAGQWDVVRQFGRILEARAMAAAGNVVSLDSKRAGKP